MSALNETIMTQGQLSYLQHGQTDAERESLREQLAADRQAVLSVCSLLCQKAVAPSEAQAAAPDRYREAITALEELIARLRTYSEKLPHPIGFFVGAEEKQHTATISARLLLSFEEPVSVLRRVSLGISTQEQALFQREGVFLSAEHTLHTVIGLSAELHDREAEASCRELLAALQEGRAAFASSVKTWREIRTLLAELCSIALPQFLSKLQADADLAKEGASASPTAVRNLMGALQHRLESARMTLITLSDASEHPSCISKIYME